MVPQYGNAFLTDWTYLYSHGVSLHIFGEHPYLKLTIVKCMHKEATNMSRERLDQKLQLRMLEIFKV
jgi:hypothetical protein